MKKREEIEALEEQTLAKYAVKSGSSKGRQFFEEEHPYRSCFQRDRDRVIHSAAFRRLEAKTQVFLGATSDYYRTRLTHTMEVAQIARTMARILSLNEDLAEAAALGHDLGHPPYGHGGEGVLNELMAEHGGFEHNRQSLRIIEYLEHPYPAFRGLNLTYETRECLAKHESRYDLPESPDEYGKGWAPLEGQIADLADAIAYNSHDLDDALECELIGEDDLSEVQLYQVLKEQVDRQFPRAKRQTRQLRCAKSLIDLLVVDALAETGRRLSEMKPQSADEGREGAQKLVELSPRGRGQLAELEDFLMKNVYQHQQVLQAQQRAEEELRYLFAGYLQNPTLLPERFQERMDGQERERVVCDYLAGMTDRYCRQMYLKMKDK